MILDHFFSLGHSSRSSASSVRPTYSSGSSRRGYSSSSGLSDDQTPVRRRDTVTITTAEIGKVFDAFNTVSAQLKLQGQALESLKNSMQDLTAELQELRARTEGGPESSSGKSRKFARK